MFGRRTSERAQSAYGRKAASPAAGKRVIASVRDRSRPAERDSGGFFSSRGQKKEAPNRRVARPVKTVSAGAAPDKSKGKGLDWGRIRLWSVGVLFSLLWLTLWARAYYLQIVMGPDYAAKAKRQYTTSEQVRGVRGNIMDRNGAVLARSVECSSVWANPGQVEDPAATARKLAEVLRLPEARLRTLLQEPKRFVWVQRKVQFATAEKVRALKLPGIYMDTEYERVYPYKQLAGQLLGFVNVDDKGIEGLEKSFDPELAGRTVTQVVERDAAGRRLMAQGTGSLVDLRGRNVRLSLDTQVQFFAEEALAENVEKFGARWGGCIVVDVPTGEVLAWAQYPFFDPNNYQTVPEADRRNRLATDMLEQGSTIKSFLIAAALEEKVVAPDTLINCEKGVWKLRKSTLHDTHPYSKLPVSKILHVSSNIGAAKIGLKLGADKYREYLTRLGFGERTGLPIPGEARGILRGSGKWAEIDLATASFGQSFSATLVQMAQAYLCLASDGLKKPLRLVLSDGPDSGPDNGPDNRPDNQQDNRQHSGRETPGAHPDITSLDKIFTAETMEQVRDMLREVVEEEGGTGKHARIPGLVVGGKTGTAQKADASGRYGRGRVGSFVGMIPIEEPRYLICVLLDEPTKVQYGGIIAAPVFRDVALSTMAYHGLLPDSDDPLVQAVARKEAQRKSGGNAKKTAASAPARPVPPASTGTAPALTAEDARAPRPPAAGMVPGVVGLGLRTAVEIFAAEGIMPVIKGTGGVVIRQTPEPGSPWPSGNRECTLWLEERTS